MNKLWNFPMLIRPFSYLPYWAGAFIRKSPFEHEYDQLFLRQSRNFYPYTFLFEWWQMINNLSLLNRRTIFVKKMWWKGKAILIGTIIFFRFYMGLVLNCTIKGRCIFTEICFNLNREFSKQIKQARKLQATLEGCNSKLSLTHWLADGGKV